MGLLAATATTSYLCRVNVSVAGALMMREFGLSEAAMGTVFSAFLAGYALCQIPGGMLADRFGARRVLAVAALGWVVSIAAMSAVAGAWAVAGLLVARFVLGVAEAPTFTAAAQAISHYVPVWARGRANGAVVAAIGVGSAIAPPLISVLMLNWGWRAALLVSALPALALAMVWTRVKRMPERVATQSEAVLPARNLVQRPFILLTASYTLQGYVGYIFVFWFYLYLINVRHFDLLRGAWLSSLPWILSIISIPLGGWLSDVTARRWGGRRLIPMIGLIGGSAFIAYGAWTPNAYAAVVCLACATSLVLCVEGPFWATMTQLAGGRAGLAGGVMNMGSNVGGFISPALTPLLAQWIGWQNALFCAAALSVLGGLLWLGIDAPEGQQTDVATSSSSL